MSHDHSVELEEVQLLETLTLHEEQNKHTSHPTHVSQLPEKEEKEIKVDPGLFKCEVCSSPTLSCCPLCEKAFYCSPKHQKLDWYRHRLVCTSTRKQGVSPDTRLYQKKANATPTAKQKTKTKETRLDRLNQAKPKRKKSLSPHTLKQKSPNKMLATVKPKQVMLVQTKYNRKAMKLTQERGKLRRQVLQSYALNKLQNGVQLCKTLEQVNIRIAEIDGEQLHEQIADSLFYAKMLICQDEVEPARQKLLSLKRVLMQEIEKEGRNNRECLLHLMCMTASMLHLIGDLRSCEMLYVEYVAQIERTHGESLLLSDCYFQLGLLYYQENIMLKARLCWEKSLAMRKRSKEHSADCLFNLGVLKYRAGQWQDALKDFRTVLGIRQECIGQANAQMADVLEYMGKCLLLIGDSKASLQSLEHSYDIRSALFQNSEHPVLVRTRNQVNLINNMMNTILGYNTPPQQIHPVFDQSEELDQGIGMTKRAIDEPLSFNQLGPLAEEESIDVMDTQNIQLQLDGLQSMTIWQQNLWYRLQDQLVVGIANGVPKATLHQVLYVSEFYQQLPPENKLTLLDNLQRMNPQHF